MARSVKKDKIINYTKEEFLKEYNISENKFKDNINKVLDTFDIKIGNLKRDGEDEDEEKNRNTVYEIKYEIAELLSIMFKNYTKKPLYDRRNASEKKSFEDIVEYNNSVMNDVERMPEYIKYTIKQHPCYKINFELTKVIQIILKKLSLLFQLILTVEKRNIGDMISEFVQDLDVLIFKYSKKKLINEWKNKNLFSGDESKSYSYNINEAIKYCFKKVIDEDNIPKYVLNKIGSRESGEDISEEEIKELREFYLNELNKIYFDEDRANEINKEFAIAERNLKMMEEFELFDHEKSKMEALYKDHTLRDKLIEIFLYNSGIYKLNFKNHFNGIDLSAFVFKLKEEVDKCNENVCENCCLIQNEEEDNLLERSVKWNECGMDMTRCEKLKKLVSTAEILEKEIIELDKKSYNEIKDGFKEQKNGVGEAIKNSLSLSLGQIIIESMKEKKN